MEISDEFVLSTQSAVSSATWLSQDEVIQKRSKDLFDGFNIRMQILNSIPDPDQLLLASKCQLKEDKDCFWVRYRRCDLPGSPAHFLEKDLSAKELIDLFKRALPDILATEELLRSAEIEQSLALALFREEVSKIHYIRMISDHSVKQMLELVGIEAKYSLPAPTDLVLSHADVIPKNVILTKNGYRLIDWETLSFYPKSLALSHALSWMFLKLPKEEGSPFLQSTLGDCLDLIGLDEDQARLSIYWQVVREALFWAGQDERFWQWLEKAEGVLNN